LTRGWVTYYDDPRVAISDEGGSDIRMVFTCRRPSPTGSRCARSLDVAPGKRWANDKFAFKKEVFMSKLLRRDLSYEVLGAAFAVHKALGPGLLEACYEGAYVVELQHRGIDVARQVVYPLQYLGEYIGAYIADVVVANTIIVELKSVARLNEVMDAQLLNYLRLLSRRFTP
jgi:GxxExxY protein